MENDKNPIQGEEDLISCIDNHQPDVPSQPVPPPSPNATSKEPGSGSTAQTLDMGEMNKPKEGDLLPNFLSISHNASSKVGQSAVEPTSNKRPVPEAPADESAAQGEPKRTAFSLGPAQPAAEDQAGEVRKAMSPQVLASLAVLDPKRARRIITNRISAVKAKERKKLYMQMLERGLQSLHSRSAALSSRLTLLQSESKSLKTENMQLKERTSSILHQIHLQDSLNDQIRDEIQNLKLLTAQFTLNGGTRVNLPAMSQNSNPATAPIFATYQFSTLQSQNPDQQEPMEHDFLQQGRVQDQVDLASGTQQQLQGHDSQVQDEQEASHLQK